jgi:uncharacterized protein YyaL (SSP411 family)
MGFLDILKKITTDWQEKPADIAQFATQIYARLQQRATAPGGADTPPGVAERAAQILVNQWDSTTRGWGVRRQFPMTANLEFMLRYGITHDNASAMSLVKGQLEAMDEGGIHDHLGGGFHRYTVDREWKIPHFEKMLYDNAQLLSVYAQAAVAMKHPRFGQVARDIADYLIREMTAPSGAFYSSQSADSEGEEGTFYVWTPTEIRAVLPDAVGFLRAYGITDAGNFVGQRTVLIREEGDPESAYLAAARLKMREHRATRENPPTDHKQVVAWNGLAIGALSRAGRLLDEPRYIAVAKAAAEAVLKHQASTGQLPRTLDNGAPAGVLEDYAFMSEGLLDLWGADPDPTWLLAANQIAEQMVQRFHDPKTGALYQAEATANLIVRRSDVTDGAEPSGPGRAASALLRLRVLGGSAGDIKIIDSVLQNAHWALDRSPDNASSLCDVKDRLERGSREVVIASPSLASPALSGFLDIVNARVRPALAFTLLSPSTTAQLSGFSAFLGKEPDGDKLRAFVCRDGVCRQPTSELDVFERELNNPEQRQ